MGEKYCFNLATIKCKVLERANRYILHLDRTQKPQTLICDYFRFFQQTLITNYQLPITNYQVPTQNLRPLTFYYHSVIKNDIWISKMAQKGMIKPFEASLIREIKCDEGSLARRVISYGLSSYGYDIRLSPTEFRIFKHIPGTVVDPKNFKEQNLESTPLHASVEGNYFILPAHSYGLGVALERLEVPDNISVICIGKSTYARCGIIANLTPAEAAWRGHLTLEFSNSSSADCRIYANEGVVQLLFLEGEPCAISYEARQGKYQDQPERVTIARI